MEANITLDDLYMIHSKILTLKKKPDRLKSFIQNMVSECMFSGNNLYEQIYNI